MRSYRPPKDESDLHYWLESMLLYHGFSPEEVGAAAGLTSREVDEAASQFGLAGRVPSPHRPGEPLRVMPYPGGRHPRIGFLDGAVNPQRETKVTIFAPWEGGGYVVADVPEAIWSDLGLTYLAHTHVPTIWSERGIDLPQLEWNRRADGSLVMARALPNGIGFGTSVVPAAEAVRVELWLRNGTNQKLTGLRVQNCVMLGHAPGFAAQTNDNKLFRSPVAAARSSDGKGWILTVFEPCERCWGNEQCPCLHSDARFPDCPPGETVRIHGRIWFFAG